MSDYERESLLDLLGQMLYNRDKECGSILVHKYGEISTKTIRWADVLLHEDDVSWETFGEEELKRLINLQENNSDRELLRREFLYGIKP